ncbi:MAG TPA: alpha/beta hydrolase [Blastocatellia bacterium]|nr:alpha/beta hydrolase [Blastocatellia bacterium]
MKKSTNGIYYKDTGSGVPVFLVHAFPLNRRMWDEQVAALGRRYRVVAPDLRGFGESDPVSGVYAVDRMASDLQGLMAALSIEAAVLVGLSMGGYAALAFLRLYPECVLSLVLANTRATADSPEAREKRLKSAARAEAEGVEGVVSDMLPLLVGNQTATARPDLVNRVRELALSTQPATIAAAQRGMAGRPDSTSLLASIQKPVLVVAGTDDLITSANEMTAMQGQIPGSTLRIIEGSGHLSNLERPIEFNEAILDFLRSR